MSSLSEETDFDLFEGLSEKSLAGADFTAEVVGELRRAFAEIKGSSDLTQKAIADRLGVGKSAVHRWLYGDGNMTLRKLGELMWAMDCRSTFTITTDLHVNHDLPNDERKGGVPAPAPSTSATVSNAQGGWYGISPISLEDAKRAQVLGAPVLLTGLSDSALIFGRILATGQNRAIAHFQGMEACFPKKDTKNIEGQSRLNPGCGTISARKINMLAGTDCPLVGEIA